MERPTVLVELAEATHLARDLSAGGLMVPDVLPLNAEVELVIRAGGRELVLAARVVYAAPGGGGCGLELIGLAPELKEQLAQLAADAVADVAADAEGEAEAEAAGEDAGDAEVAEGDADANADADADAEPTEPGDGGAGGPRRRIALNLNERLRGLTLAQQIKKAHSSDPGERTMLERLYGKNVWEALLRNPRLTAPEVSRIARMGTLPRILLEQIVNNGAWLQIPEVRRALLANPRLGTDQILRVLRLLPKHELKLATATTAYPMAVRDAAKRLLKDD